MKILEIPDSIYARAYYLMTGKYVIYNDQLKLAENAYVCEVGRKGFSEGELEKAIYEHMTSEGWSSK